MAAIEATLPRGTPIELWWQDEARVGQKNGITRRWAKRGTRPSAPKDQRTTSAYIYGAICPAEGQGAALVLPRCNTAGMTLHLAEISAAVAPGVHAVLLLDQAGWHGSRALVIPANITLMPLPPKCPELNPVEDVWQFMRDNWLSNRIFKAYDDILDHCYRHQRPSPDGYGARHGAPSELQKETAPFIALRFVGGRDNGRLRTSLPRRSLAGQEVLRLGTTNPPAGLAARGLVNLWLRGQDLAAVVLACA